MEEVNHRKLPRGQAGLNERARKLMVLPRHVKWREQLIPAQTALIRRASRGEPVMKKNLSRLEEALNIAEGSYRGQPLLKHDEATLPPDMHPFLEVSGLAQRTYTEDALKAIQTMLQLVPDATVNWQGLVIKTYLGDS